MDKNKGIKMLLLTTVVLLLGLMKPVEIKASGEVAVGSFGELANAVESGSATLVYLDADIRVNNSSRFLPNHDVTVDGRGRYSIVSPSNYSAFDINSGRSVILRNMNFASDGATAPLINVASGAVLHMKNCTLTGDASGGITNNGTLILENVSISGCGQALNNNGTAILNGCSLSKNGNQSANLTSVIYQTTSNSKLYANNCVFLDNESGLTDDGGAFYLKNGASMYLMNCTLTGTNAAHSAIYDYGQYNTIKAVNSIIVGNYSRNHTNYYDIYSANNQNCVFYNTLYGANRAGTAVSGGTGNKTKDGVFGSNTVKTRILGGYDYYIQVKPDGDAATGGTDTYFFYDESGSTLYMGYGAANVELLCVGAPTEEQKNSRVTTYYEGGTRENGVIGASGLPYPTVIFDSNGGSTVASQQMITDETVVTQPTVPTKEGYTFAGWFGDSDLTQAYVFGRHESNSITLYAKWTITDPVAVTFDANGGTGIMSVQTVPKGVATQLNTMSGLIGPAITPVFTGWNTMPDGSGASYEDGAGINTATNVTLYAQWVALQDTESYTVTDQLNMIVTLKSATPANLKVALASPAREVIVPAAISLTAGEYDGSSDTYGKANTVVTLNASYGITVAASNEVQLKNLKIMSASGYSTGTSKITNNGTLSMEECTVTGDGGGINNASGKTAAIKKCDFYQNVFSGIGSAINNAGTIVVDGCSFKENVASGEGSIYNSGTIYVNNSIFADNGAGDYTGGIMHQGTAAYLINCTFTGNVHAYNRIASGGGITVWSGPLTAVNCIVLDNYINGVTTKRDAGRNGGTLNLINCLTGGNLYSVSSETNPKTDTTHSAFIGYVDTPVRTSYSNAATTVSPHRCAIVETQTDSGRYLRYAPASGGGPAATGGVDTYFRYDDNGSNIALGYGSGSSITSLVGTATSAMKVDKYYEGTDRISGVIGASAASPAVVFNANGGKGSKGAQLYTKGVAFTLNTLDNAFYRTGYTFAGWATSPNGTVAYADGGFAAFTADVTTLYAAWIPAKYNITYNAGDGSGSMSRSNNLDYGSIVTFKSNSFSDPSGKVFAGWLDADGRYYSNNARITVTGDMNLTAQWGTPVSDFSNITAGIYVLTQDVTVSAAVAIPDGVTICGDGHTVSVEHPYVREDGTVRTAAYNAASAPDGYSNYNVFTVTDSDSSDSNPVIVRLRNMTIIGGYNTNGAVYNNAGKISLQDVTITRSSRGLLNNNGIVVMERCDISGNAGANTGVGVGSAGANSVMVIDGCSFTDNRYTNGSNTDGGSAIYIAAGRGYANNSVIANNTSNGAVGAVTAGNDLFYMTNCTITGNILLHSNKYGAGLKNNIYAANCIVADNYYISNEGALESCDNSQTSAVNLNKYLLNSLSNIKGTPVAGVENIGVRRDTGSLPTGTTATLSTAFPHPAVVSDRSSTGTLRYVPVKSGGTAADGGVSTYFYYPADIGLISTSTVTMGYGETPAAIGNAALDDGTHEVQTYYEGGARSANVYGACGVADGICHVVPVEAEGGSVKGILSWGEYYTSGTQVSVEAVADTYYEFKGWTASGITLSDAQKASPTLTFTVNSDVTLTPIFEFIATEVTVSTLDELKVALLRASVETVYVSNVIPLTAGTVLDGNGKTVQVPVPYVNEDGTVNENASNWGVFNVTGVTATIKNMIIVGGKAAAIQENMQLINSSAHESNLTIENVTITRASCAISDSCSFLYMKNSILTKNIGTNSSAISVGAGWYTSAATIVMDNCSVVDNRSTTGGAVVCICGQGANSGTHYFYANNSVFANNTTINTCAGIYVAKSGNVWAKAYLTNCTIAGNKLENASGQGAGLNVGANGAVSAVNCIIADNYDKDGKQSNVEGTISPKIANYIMDNGGTDPSLFASSYESDGKVPQLTDGAYIPAKGIGPAASGGTKTYFGVNGTTVKMGYDEPGGTVAKNLLGNGTTDAAAVTSFYEGTSRSDTEPRVIGASGAIVKDCTVKFDTCDGSSIEDVVVREGALVSKPADPVKSGFAFAGWYKDSSLTQEFDFSTDIAICGANDCMTLYAKWAVEITAANISIDSKVYTGSALSPDVVVTYGTNTLVEGTHYSLLINPDSEAATPVNRDCINAGSYPVIVSANAAGGYSGSVEATFTIEPKPVTVTAGDKNKTYGDADPTLTAEIAGTVGTDTVAYALSRVAGEDVKDSLGNDASYAITPSGEGIQGNYAVTFVPGYLTVSPKTVTLSWNQISFVYSGEPLAPEAIASGIVGDDVCGVSVSVAGEHTDANESGQSYIATATGLSNSNYALPENENDRVTTFTITKADNPAVIGSEATVMRGGNTISLAPENAVGDVTYSIVGSSYSEGNGGCTISDTGLFTSGDIVGSCSVKIEVAGNRNYKAAEIAVTVTITEKNVTTLSVTQNGTTVGTVLEDPSFDTVSDIVSGPVISYSGTLRKDSSSYGPTDVKPDEAGNYTVTVTFETLSTVYTGSAVFVIAPRDISDAEVVLGTALTYNGTAQTQEVTAVNVTVGSEIDIKDYCTITANTGTDAGDYTLTVTALDASNYTGTVQKTFSINKKSTTPSVTVSGNYIFTGEPIIPVDEEYTVKDGENGAELVRLQDYSVEFSDNVDAGEATITVKAAENGNYSFDDMPAHFTINKAAAPSVENIGFEHPFTTTTITRNIRGLPNNMGTASYTAGTPKVSGNAVVQGFSVDEEGKISAAFENASVGDTITLPVMVRSTNYEDTTVTFVAYLIAKNVVEVEIEEGTEKTVTYGDEQFKLHGVLKGEDPDAGKATWRWTSNNEEVATVADDGTITVTGAGDAKLTARYESEWSTGTVLFSLKVKPREVTISGVKVSDKTYDATTTATIEDKGTINGIVNDDDVTIVQGNASFTDKNAGKSKTVVLEGFAIAGDRAGCYVLKQQPDAAGAVIIPLEVNTSADARPREYKSNKKTVELENEKVIGILDGDSVSVNMAGARGEMKDAYAGTGKEVTVSGIALAGADALNYTPKQPAGLTVNIYKAQFRDIELSRCYMYSEDAYEQIELESQLPSDRGKTTYKIPVTQGDINYKVTPAVSNGAFSYTVGAANGVRSGKLILTIEMSNYKDAKLIVNIDQTALALYEKTDKTYSMCGSKNTTVGKTFDLFPMNGNGNIVNGKMIWSSTNPDIATVTQTGRVAARSGGTTTIIATREDNTSLKAVCALTVTEPVTKVLLDTTKHMMGTGESLNLKATILPKAAIQRLVWTVDNENVSLEVSADTLSAKVIGRNVGKARITAVAADGSGIKGTCDLDIGTPVGNFSVSGKGGAKAVKAGKTLAMNVTWKEGKPKNAGVTWTVATPDGKDASGIAEISEKGVLSGYAEGLVRVTAVSKANSEKKAYADIEVYVPVKKVALNVKSGSVSRAAGANGLQLSVDITSAIKDLPATGTALGKQPTVTWSIDSAYTGYASVSQSGLVTAGSISGKTVPVNVTVTAYGGYSKKLTCKVTVKESNELKGIKLSQSKLSIRKGTETDLKAIFNPINPDGDTGVIWTSYNPHVVEVDGNGHVKAKGIGSTTIHAWAKGTVTKGGNTYQPSATCKVTVTPEIIGMSVTNSNELEANGLVAGRSYKLNTRVIFAGQGKVSKDDIVYTVSDNSIATVTPNGIIKALKSSKSCEGGKTTVTVSAGGIEQRIDFAVYSRIKKITLDKKKLSIGTAPGSEYGKICVDVITPSDADNKAICWTANNSNVLLAAVDEDVPASAIDDDDYKSGAVTGTAGQAVAIKALKPGTVRITAWTTDGTYKRVTCTVTVRGYVTKLELRQKTAKDGFMGITPAETAEGEERCYTTIMKPGKTIKPEVILQINDIDAIRDQKTYNKYKKLTDVSVSYRSSDTSVATVDKNGKIKISKDAPEGSTAVIQMASADGACTAALKITVKN